MICPACAGTGEVASRWLWFFTRRRSCRTCAGTGRMGALRAKKAAEIASGDDDRRRELYSDRRYDSYPSSVSSGVREPDEPFEAFSGGRSGGGGAGGSWDEETGSRDAAPQDDRDVPLIVDPFLADSPSSDSSDPGSDDASSGSDESGPDSDGGTSY